MLAYIAGPLFNEGERWFNQQLEAVVREAGFETFMPQRDGLEGGMKTQDDVKLIFELNLRQLEAADVVVANLNGVTSDDGTAWEMGYAYARGKYIIGVYTDWRLTFRFQVVNLMLEVSTDCMARSLDALRDCLREYAARRDG